MQLPIEVTFRNMDRSDAVEARVLSEAEKLERFHDRITSCRVTVEAPHRHSNKGRLYEVHIELRMPPGKTIMVDHSKRKNHAHEDVYVAVRDAFRAATRQLEDLSRKIRGEVKSHEAPLHGTVRRLLRDEGYGFIDTSDGQEIYFHRNAVVNEGFDQLEEGSQVRLVIAHGESAEGPQASTVTPVGKHHIVE